MSGKDNPYVKATAGKSAASAALIFFGILVMCCCGGMSQYGDYIGPPEGLAEYQRGMKMRLGVCVAVGLTIVGLGIWQGKKGKSQPPQDPD